MVDLLTVTDSTLFDVVALVWLVVVGGVATWLGWDACVWWRSMHHEVHLLHLRRPRRERLRPVGRVRWRSH